MTIFYNLINNKSRYLINERKTLSILIVVALVIVLIFYFTKTRKNSDSLDQYIIFEDERFRVSKTEDEEFYYVSIFNKKTEKLEFRVFDLLTNEEVDSSKYIKRYQN